ncbi:dipeptidase PepE [Saccharicrinis sp. FJH62]|uniref:dipeptidase PepE n=1 Tax=Saccharicrinis sp. FJH62 TaxID=3344657 RepID=UPI0035D47CB3
MQLLLISNSTNAGEAYLEYPREEIRKFLSGSSKIVFIPFAAVGFSYDTYTEKVNESLSKAGLKVTGIHTFPDQVKAIKDADAIMVGGGNTFQLVAELYNQNLMEVIRERVVSGIKYVGWSAGSNITCPTLMTTNDMPVTEPKSFKTLNLIPFQINPHYMDANPDGHAGETREQRINEFTVLHPEIWVAGLRESTMFLVTNDSIILKGPKTCRIFKFGKEPLELSSEDNFSFLLN